MLIGWIFFIVGLFLNALVLVVLVNRDQLTHLGAQLKRPDESELKIGEPVVQRLDEEVAEPAVDMDAEPLPEDLPDAARARHRSIGGRGHDRERRGGG